MNVPRWSLLQIYFERWAYLDSISIKWRGNMSNTYLFKISLLGAKRLLYMKCKDKEKSICQQFHWLFPKYNCLCIIQISDTTCRLPVLKQPKSHWKFQIRIFGNYFDVPSLLFKKSDYTIWQLLNNLLRTNITSYIHCILHLQKKDVWKTEIRLQLQSISCRYVTLQSGINHYIVVVLRVLLS